MIPSAYQLAIWKYLDEEQGDLLVAAMAGSGKTSSIVEYIKKNSFSDPPLLVAFNVTIKNELLRRLDGILAKRDIKTIHGVGWAALNAYRKNPQLTDKKYSRLFEDYWNQCMADGSIPEGVREAVATVPETYNIIKHDILTLHKMVRFDLVDPRDTPALTALMHRRTTYPLYQDVAVDAVEWLLKKGWEKFEKSGEIDFTDMVYYPASRSDLWPMKRKRIFVDEAQDLSAMARKLVFKCRDSQNGRICFIGDARQAIYAFAGADAESWDQIKVEGRNVAQLPLSVNYRSGSTILSLAQRVVPEIQPRENAPLGDVQWISEAQGIDEIKADQNEVMILCRMNAPLISLCIRFIQQRIPARVKGRDIGKELCAVLETIRANKGDYFKYDDLYDYLYEYQTKQVEFLENQGASELAIKAIEDKVEALKTCYRDFGASDLDQLIEEIYNLFEDALTPKEYMAQRGSVNATCRYNHQLITDAKEDRQGITITVAGGETFTFSDDNLKEPLIMRDIVWLSTVHKAKGLEARRVYVVQPELMPYRYQGQPAWELQQEMNIWYVAVTRAMDSLKIMGKFSMDELNQNPIKAKSAKDIESDLAALDEKHGVTELKHVQQLLDTLTAISGRDKIEIVEEMDL